MQNRSINLEFIYQQIYLLLSGERTEWLGPWARTLGDIVWWLLVASIPILLFAFFRLVRKTNAIYALTLEEQRAKETAAQAVATGRVSAAAQAWQKIMARLESASEAEWKAAVLEADKMLEELVAQLYPHLGESLGERLKKVEPSDFPDLDAAWAAHKVRNQIAHEANYQLSAREARAALENYKKVFTSFQYL